MERPLYLDTARLGQMSAPASAASIDLTRLAHEQGCSLYFTQLLKRGFDSWPASLQTRYRGLSTWQGVPVFQDRLKRLAGASPESNVVLASRSAWLMRLAARLLSSNCRKVLISDSCWPAYREILQQQCEQSETKITVCPTRRAILSEYQTASSIVNAIVEQFLAHQCEGLFLPLVDNWGVRLPVEAIVAAIRRRAKLRFVAIDGAQALGHVPLNLASGFCDLLLAGSHKWLRAFQTMGVGYFGDSEHQSQINDLIQRWQRSPRQTDPLLNFTHELAGGEEVPFGETVQVTPLLVANAAITGIMHADLSINERNRQIVTTLAKLSGWQTLEMDRSFRTNILLLRPRRRLRTATGVVRLRQRLLNHGVAATVYAGGLVRLSLPHDDLSRPEIHQLRRAIDQASVTRTVGPKFPVTNSNWQASESAR